MTNKELEQSLKAVSNKQWFDGLEVAFSYAKIDVTINKKGFSAIYQYVRRQANGWEKIKDKLSTEFNESKNHWTNLLTSLDYFLISQRDQEQTNTLGNSWNSLQNKINQINRNYFPIDAPEVVFLLETYKISPSHYVGAQKYLLRGNSLNFQNKEEFAGAIMSYEYSYKDGTILPKRRNSEKSSNSKIRNEFEKSLSESQEKVRSFISDSEQNWQKITDLINDKVMLQTSEVNRLINEKRTSYEQWVSTCKQNDADYTKHQLERVKELEVLYEKKLSLEKPAQFWKERADSLKKSGRLWMGALILAVASSVYIFFTLLNNFTDTNFEKIFSNAGTGIRWSIIFITTVSFLAFLIKAFFKMTLSSFHLMRDAQEREKLVFVYLSLSQAKGIGEAERHLILQSIFSRSDSGLLKDTSSPSMPGSSGFIDKLISKG